MLFIFTPCQFAGLFAIKRHNSSSSQGRWCQKPDRQGGQQTRHSILKEALTDARATDTMRAAVTIRIQAIAAATPTGQDSDRNATTNSESRTARPG